MPVEHLADQPADPAESDHQDLPFPGLRRASGLGDARDGAAGDSQPQGSKGRDAHHGKGRRDQKALPQRIGNQSLAHGRGEDDEGKFPAGRQEQGGFHGWPPFQAKPPGKPEDQGCVQAHEAKGHPSDLEGLLEDQADIQADPDGQKEEPEEEALEGLNDLLDLMAKLGLGQEQAGNEGTERHGESGESRQQAGPQDHQEAGGHEQLLAPCLGYRPHHGAQEEAAEPDQGGDCSDSRRETEEQVGRQARAALATEER